MAPLKHKMESPEQSEDAERGADEHEGDYSSEEMEYDDNGELPLSSEELDEMLGISGEEVPQHHQQQEDHAKQQEQPQASDAEEGKRSKKRKVQQEGSQEEGQAKKAKRVLSKDEMLKMKDKAERRGVLYVSRIPPHMKPGKLRQLLSMHGEVGRVYCAPEDSAARKDRKKKGKDSGKNFTEGWVEFEDKRVAKRIAAQLNGKPIGGKKRSAYYFDLWCLKYLSKFKWDHLTEEINYQRAVREQRLAAEISSAKRERDFYLSRVDRAKAIEAIRERKKGKAQPDDQTGSGVAGEEAAKQSGAKQGGAAAQQDAGVKAESRGRFFRQTRGKADALDIDAPALADDVLALVGAGGKRRRG